MSVNETACRFPPAVDKNTSYEVETKAHYVTHSKLEPNEFDFQALVVIFKSATFKGRLTHFGKYAFLLPSES